MVKMCGILVSTSDISQPINKLLVNRGPDGIGLKNLEGINFLHTLLSMTGEFTQQPIVKDNVVFLLNGEIYNYKDKKYYPSDIYYIVDLYSKYGKDFVKYIDGEYSIVIADLNKNKLFFCTDIFGTKPLFFSNEESGFGISSYSEPLIELGFKNINKVEPSTLKVYDLKTFKLKSSNKYFEFELTQNKNNYDSWIDGFLSAVEKRFKDTDKKIILPLSSGFDSGAIASAFNYLGINATYYSFFNYEHEKVLKKRIKQIIKSEKIYVKQNLDEKERNFAKELINDKCSVFSYGANLENQEHVFQGIDDPGAHGLAYLLNEAKSDNQHIKILASGQGADEIMSNIQSYSFGKPNPEFFPDNLQEIFPWENFYFGTQSSYLAKEESISGGFGIEGRYPFLDKYLVQEYLNLNNDLKNKEFKAPIVHMLKKFKYPYRKGRTILGKKIPVKSGFSP